MSAIAKKKSSGVQILPTSDQGKIIHPAVGATFPDLVFSS